MDGSREVIFFISQVFRSVPTPHVRQLLLDAGASTSLAFATSNIPDPADRLLFALACADLPAVITRLDSHPSLEAFVNHYDWSDVSDMGFFPPHQLHLVPFVRLHRPPPLATGLPQAFLSAVMSMASRAGDVDVLSYLLGRFDPEHSFDLTCFD